MGLGLEALGGWSNSQAHRTCLLEWTLAGSCRFLKLISIHSPPLNYRSGVSSNRKTIAILALHLLENPTGIQRGKKLKDLENSIPQSDIIVLTVFKFIENEI